MCCGFVANEDVYTVYSATSHIAQLQLRLCVTNSKCTASRPQSKPAPTDPALVCRLMVSTP